MKGFLVFPILLLLLFGTPTFADFQISTLKGGKVPILLKNSEFFSRTKPFAF
jgi:hypothetical protein